MSQYSNPPQGGYTQQRPPQQPVYNQAPYGGQNPYPPYNQQPSYPPQYAPQQPAAQQMTLGNWILTMIVLSIPVVGFIMLFVWGFGGQEQPSRRTYCQATLLWILIVVVISIIIFLITGISLGALFASGALS